MFQNNTNQNLMKESRYKFQNYLKGLIAQKVDDDDLVDTDIDREKMMKNMRRQIGYKKAKKIIQNQINKKLMKEIIEKIQMLKQH